MFEVSKGVKIAAVAVLLCVTVVISLWASGKIASHGFDISQVDDWVVEPTESTEAIDALEAMRQDMPAGLRDLYNLQQGDMSDAEYAVCCCVALLKYSPMAADIEASRYTVKLLDDYWVVKYECPGYEVFVKCDSKYFQPVVFMLSREFTQTEREYFYTLGNIMEVDNGDGTHSIYFI